MLFKIRLKSKPKPTKIAPSTQSPVTLVSCEMIDQPVTVIKLIRHHTELGLRDAKHHYERFIGGEQVTIYCISEENARQFIDDAAQLGITAKHADHP